MLFRDTNHIGLDADSITDATPEFVLVGSAASNVQIDGAGVKVGNNVYRYQLSKKDNQLPLFEGRHDLRPAQHDRDPVHRRRLQGHRGRDQQGSSQAFYVNLVTGGGPNAAADAPTQIPTAELLSPFSGSTLSVRSLISRPYIDVNFNTGGAGVLTGIDGDELALTGPGAVNLDIDGAPDRAAARACSATSSRPRPAS